MDEKSTATDLDELLQHASWVKGLAFASLRGAALAEDVSQEVLLKALAGPRRSGRILRAWLAAVTRNTARNELRGIIRRRQREEKVARGESGHSRQSQTDILQAHRELTLAVEALSPKHREVIVMRFFEERSFKQMAAQLGGTEGNMRVRLHRALIELRNLLSESGGDWRASCLVLAPMAVMPAPSISLPTSSKLLLAASLTVLLGGAWWWLDRDGSADKDLESSVVAQVDPADAGSLDMGLEDVAGLDGGAVRLNREAIIAPVDQEVVENEFRGMVLADGFPVAGAQVVAGQVDDLTRTTTATDGTFTVILESSAKSEL
jgi:RNA polymerase sigma factor (sigma-70 family)